MIAVTKNSDKEQTLSGLVHDLRQPLGAAKIWTQLLVANLRDELPERERTYLEKLEAEIARIERVLEGAAQRSGDAATSASTSSPAEASQHPCAEATAALESARVLIVEDDVMTAEALQIALEDAGALVRTAEDVSTALSLHHQEPADVIVSDLTFPGESGVDLLREVRARDERASRRTRVIALSGYVDSIAGEHDGESGFDDRLTKPVSIDLLVEKIRALLDRA